MAITTAIVNQSYSLELQNPLMVNVDKHKHSSDDGIPSEYISEQAINVASIIIEAPCLQVKQLDISMITLYQSGIISRLDPLFHSELLRITTLVVAII